MSVISPTGESRHIALDLLEGLLLLLEGLGGLQQLVVRLVESDLELLHFLAVVSDVAVSLIEIIMLNKVSLIIHFFKFKNHQNIDKNPGKLYIYLIGNLLVIPGGLLELGDGGVESVRLALEALHLLPDGVHTGGCGGLGGLGSKGDSL